MLKDIQIDPADYHVIIKRRDVGPKPWRWEIWVAGRSRHVERSEHSFERMADASREGKAALKAFLSEHFPSAA